jgi:hypothetical protein
MSARRRSFFVCELLFFLVHCPLRRSELLDLFHYFHQRTNLSGLFLFAKAKAIQHERAPEQLDSESESIRRPLEFLIVYVRTIPKEGLHHDTHNILLRNEFERILP